MFRRLDRMVVLAGVLLGMAASPSLAQIGTAPPFLCGRTYSFAKGAVNANVLEDEPGLVRVETLHFVKTVGATFGGGCPDVTATVTMEATLACDDGTNGGPHVFGPFPVGVGGFTVVPIDVPVAAGGVRVCDLEVVSTLTFSDGMVLRQRGDLKVSVVQESHHDPFSVGLELELIGDSAAFCDHPGGTRTLRFRLTNRVENGIGDVSIVIVNRAGMPTVVAGANNSRTGAYSVSDPGGGDAPAVDLDDECPPSLGVDPHLIFQAEGSTDFILAEGGSFEFDIHVNNYALAMSGAVGEAVVEAFMRSLEDPLRTYSAHAGVALGVDANKPAVVDCPGSGRAAIASIGSSPKGPALSYLADGTPGGNEPFNVLYIVDPATVKMFVNGSPINGTNFSGAIHGKDQLGRHAVELSFLSPRPASDSVIQFNYEIIVEPTTPGYDVNSMALGVVDGAPNGYAHLHPVARGHVDLTDSRVHEAVRLLQIHQLSAVGVDEGTFSPRQMELVDLSMVPLRSEGRIRVESTWKAVTPGAPRYIGFDVFHDIRASATPMPEEPCPADFNGDTVVNTLDVLAFLNAYTSGDPRADFNGDTVINTLDLLAFLNAYTAGCP
ncbi:MAG TPA: GC-type dockerin domain-anchored protein [Phycisphaerales bacterium]|nr:GC-type dockerin domain-anchored protein [Phycisphaerales bacterium]